ncbi:MAG: hypothetical protein LBK25_02950 [Treponema sp.]|nr:hypothetical protein [Treponema sp.]
MKTDGGVRHRRQYQTRWCRAYGWARRLIPKGERRGSGVSRRRLTKEQRKDERRCQRRGLRAVGVRHRVGSACKASVTVLSGVSGAPFLTTPRVKLLNT